MKSEKPVVLLLVRSYNRPKFLKLTMESLYKSDIDLCNKRLIYDDCSSDEETLHILNDIKYINDTAKGFSVIKGTTNIGVKKSYLETLEYIKKNEHFDVLISLDNDVVVKPFFINKMLEEFQKIAEIYGTKQFLLTGFNPINSHKNMIEEYDTFYRKKTCGGVNYCFHTTMLDHIYLGWKMDRDDGVMRYLEQNNIPLYCLKKSVLNHIGFDGIHGIFTKLPWRCWDYDPNFTESTEKMCSRNDCYFLRHTDINNNGGTHCCKTCKQNNKVKHGAKCEMRFKEMSTG